MDVIFSSALSTFPKQVFNQIRLFMKIITVSDILIPGSIKLKPNVLNCDYAMKSTLDFPYIKPFHTSWLPIWKSIIRTMIMPRVISTPPNRWVSTSHLTSPTTPPPHNSNTNEPILLEDDDICVTSEKIDKAVKLIHKNILQSPKWLKHILGKSKLSHKCIHRLLTLAHNKRLVLATDASVNEGKAAHRFCFADEKKGSVIFSSGSKVEGPHDFLSSYRAEMTFIIAAVSLIDTILSSVGMTNTAIILHTDSETSITTSRNQKLNTLHYVISNNIDAALQLQQIVSKCTQSISLVHVEGHQDKEIRFRDLPIPAQLNVLMDALSKKTCYRHCV